MLNNCWFYFEYIGNCLTTIQLSFYALAATNIPTEPFGKKPEEIKLSLYYLDQQEKITTTRTKEQLKNAIEIGKEACQKIYEVQRAALRTRYIQEAVQ